MLQLPGLSPQPPGSGGHLPIRPQGLPFHVSSSNLPFLPDPGDREVAHPLKVMELLPRQASLNLWKYFANS